MKLLLIFIVLNIANVILQTIKSIATVKCGKWGASFINAVAFGLYTIVVVYLNCALALWLKALIVALCNLVGVYVVKAIEEKARKDKIWKIETVIPVRISDEIIEIVKENKISYSLTPLFNQNKVTLALFAYSQQESAKIKNIFKQYTIHKYFISETKDF